MQAGPSFWESGEAHVVLDQKSNGSGTGRDVVFSG